MEIKDILLNKINKSLWWHTQPRDPNAYKKRGKFLASTYDLANFYGKPNIDTEKVNIEEPVYGFSEIEIIKQLGLEKEYKDFERTSGLIEKKEASGNYISNRFKMDRLMCLKAKKLGYDSIILVCGSGQKSLANNRKPREMELNILYPKNNIQKAKK